MQRCELILLLNLQMFADGGADGDGGTGNAGTTADSMLATSTKGAKNPLASVQYGVQEDVQTADAPETATEVTAEDRNAKFEALIKGEYKDLYDARMQDTIQKRLKSTKDTVDRYNELTPTIELLARKYGVDANDIKALNSAIEEDDAYYEDEAYEKGLTVEQLKSIKKMERENAELKRQMQETQVRENADRIYASWMEQAESLKPVYPTFDLQTELQNQKFTDLIRNNIDVRTAYEVVHKDEIIPQAMAFTASKVTEKIANSIRTSGNRPSENGLSHSSSAVVKSDVSQLSKEDRLEIARRVARGEKIRF